MTLAGRVTDAGMLAAKADGAMAGNSAPSASAAATDRRMSFLLFDAARAVVYRAGRRWPRLQIT
jgi:hypothetical protein